MLKRWTMLGLVTFAAMAQVQAAVITYDFTATVHDVSRYDQPFLPPVAIFTTEGPEGGAAITIGHQISGRFSFDNAQPADWVSELPGSGNSYYHLSNGTVSYTLLSSNTTFSSGTQLASWNYPDASSIDNFVVYGDNPISTLWFEDLTKTLFSHGMPKGTLSLGSLSRADLSAAWFRSDGELVGFTAALDTLTLAAPTDVPEPGTWGLMLAGMGAFGAAARRRRSSKLPGQRQ